MRPGPRIRNINISTEFVRIGEIDTLNEKYHAEVIIYANWIADEPTMGNEYDPKVHWNPKLYVENLLDEQKEEKNYYLSLDEGNNRVVNEIRRIKGVFWERLELENFPIDIQELSVIVTTYRTPSEVLLINDRKKVSKLGVDASKTFVEQQKWKLFKFVRTSQTASYDGSNQMDTRSPKVVTSSFCSRRPGYYFSNAYFLIFLITVSCLTTFAIDYKLPQARLQTTFTLLLTLISFKWVVNRSLPTIAYLTSLDKYTIATIFYMSIMGAYHAIIGKPYWSDFVSLEIEKWVLIVFAVFFVLIHIYLIIWLIKAYSSIHKLKREEHDFLLKIQQNSAFMTRI